MLAGDDSVLPLIEMLAASEYFDAGKAIPETAGHGLPCRTCWQRVRRSAGGVYEDSTDVLPGTIQGVWRPLPCVEEGRAPLTKEISRR